MKERSSLNLNISPHPKREAFFPLENSMNQNSTSEVKQVKLTKYIQNIALSQQMVEMLIWLIPMLYSEKTIYSIS